jgi:type IV secretion system protein VirB9
MTMIASVLAPALALAAPAQVAGPQMLPAIAVPSPAALAAAAKSRRPGRAGEAPPPTVRVAAANRAALQEPTSDAFVDSVQVYSWIEGGIYRLYTAPGHVTDIALEAGETLTAVAAGDTVRWIVGDTTSGSGIARRVHILLKPTAAGLSTNLVITTDRRIYRLEAESTPRTAMAAVSWTYPGGSLLALGGVTASSAAQLQSDAEPFDFDYVLKGDKPSWRPRRVFDDGQQVFIEFPPGFARDQAPPLFGKGTDGHLDLLNYRVRGRYYVVDRLFETAELRLGGKKQQVVRIRHRQRKSR